MEEQKVCNKCNILQNISEFKIRKYKDKTQRRKECRLCINERTRKLWQKVRKEIFDYYGWVCKCCGDNHKEFMTLDHIHNDGFKDKNPNGSKKSGKELYLLVKKQGFPDKYQTLCHNCNFAKKLINGCPHQYEK